MCGIAGFWNPGNKKSSDELSRIAGAMADTLAHRGPDDRGVWAEAAAGVAFGFRRLSIIDLSVEGCQPMASSCGRFMIVYNGEVYNFGALRSELEPLGCSFRGHSDTEVILAAFSHWGVEESVKKFIGMFAIALWDAKDRVMYLIRDRLGIKPLYYGWAGGSFVFGSELKAIRAFPDFRPAINNDNLPLYFHYGYIPSPYSIYQDVNSLQPGCMLAMGEKAAAARSPRISRFWSAYEVAEKGKADPFRGTDEEAAAELERLLSDSVKLRMIADVPLGAFLSGGIDSSAVVALMQARNTGKVRTFTIGFHEKGYNEAEHAAAVARRLGTEHTELYVTEREAMDVIPRIPDMYDEPFADSSQIPTFLVSRLTRKHVTVSLSGDGGDEILGGYTRYRDVGRDWALKGKIPLARRRLMASALRAAAAPGMNWLMLPAAPLLLLKGKTFNNMRERALHRARGLDADGIDAFYDNSLALYPDVPGLLRGAKKPPTVLTAAVPMPGLEEPVERMMYADMMQYLPDDILTKVDRASMSVSLEARVPLLDHRVVEFAWSLPLSMKLRGEDGKLPLRRVLYKYVPRELVERPKMGFGIPVGRWIRDPLKDWAEELLSWRALDECGIFKTETVRKKWKEHVAGIYDHEYMLWTVLMFQAWRKRWSVS